MEGNPYEAPAATEPNPANVRVNLLLQKYKFSWHCFMLVISGVNFGLAGAIALLAAYGNPVIGRGILFGVAVLLILMATFNGLNHFSQLAVMMEKSDACR